MELWKDVVGFEGYYQVSNIGNVKSLSRVVNCNGGKKTTQERLLQPKNDKDGYKEVAFCINNKMSYFRVHRLMLMAFIGAPPSPDSFGMHLDDNPANNVLENLKWGSNSENILMAIANGKKHPTRPWLGKTGKNHPLSKIVHQYSLSGELIKTFHGTYEAQRETNVRRSDISSVCTGRQLTAGGYMWKYDSV